MIAHALTIFVLNICEYNFIKFYKFYINFINSMIIYIEML